LAFHSANVPLAVRPASPLPSGLHPSAHTEPARYGLAGTVENTSSSFDVRPLTGQPEKLQEVELGSAQKLR